MTIENLTNSQVIRLKGRIFTITVVQLLQSDVYAFEQQLESLINQAPRLFYKIPVILDCSVLTEELNSFMPYFAVLKKFQLYPIGVQGTHPWLTKLVGIQEIPLFQSSSANDKNLELTEKKKTTKPVIKTTELPRATKVITQPVRSGQQVVSKNGDLIVTSSVSYGAELLADGHIHVYGPLRGRALAGIAGDKQARIFCTQLDAELVSIAGFYRLRESIPPISGPCQIFIQDERLQVLPL